MFLTNHYNIKEVLAFPFMKDDRSQGKDKGVVADGEAVVTAIDGGVCKSHSTDSGPFVISSHPLYSAQMNMEGSGDSHLTRIV